MYLPRVSPQTVDTGFHWGPAFMSHCYKHVCTKHNTVQSKLHEHDAY